MPNVGLIEKFGMDKAAYKSKRLQRILSWYKDGYCDLDLSSEQFNSPFEDRNRN